MKKIPLYQVDAFTDRLFSGNPAAVCILEEWIGDEVMQNIAAENNLAETAFLVPAGDRFEIRWFTPSVEVELCGHASLASGYVLFNCLHFGKSVVDFYSPITGVLKVMRRDELLFLDFPADTLSPCRETALIESCLGVAPKEIWRGKYDYIAELQDESEINNLSPDFTRISGLPGRGLCVTAPGDEVDFVSRFFAPQSGIMEDPVTGSAHTSLIPLWSKKSGKRKMVAKQLSKRGGMLVCEDHGARCLIGGKARLYLTGEIRIG